jgi:hypothetical protein
MDKSIRESAVVDDSKIIDSARDSVENADKEEDEIILNESNTKNN